MKTFKILLMVFIASFVLAGCNEQLYSEGDRIGTVYKLSYKGLDDYCGKTWEGELALPAIAGSDGSGNSDVEGQTGNVWQFSIDPADVGHIKDALQAAMDRGKRVRIHYQQFVYHDCHRGKTEYRAKAVTTLE